MKLSYDVDHNVFRAAEQGDLTELSGDVEVIEDLLPSLAKVSGTPAAGDVLEYDTTAKAWKPKSNYVKVSGTPAAGNVLEYDTTAHAWKPKSNYVKVDGTPEEGDVLVYDDTSDTWKPDAPGGGGAGLFTIEVTGTWNDATQQNDVAIPEATIEAAVAAVLDGEASLICLSCSITGETDHDYEYLSPIRVYYSSPDNWEMFFSSGVIQGESDMYTGAAPWNMQNMLVIPFYGSGLLLQYDSTNQVYANYAID